MSTLTKPFTFGAGTTILAAEVNSDFDTLFNDYNGNITNPNIAANADIAGSKILNASLNLDTKISNGIKFHAYRNTALSIPNNTFTKVTFDTEVFDTDNFFDSTTNNRFAPTTTGKYLFTASATFDDFTAVASTATIQLARNGSTLIDGNSLLIDIAGDPTLVLATIINHTVTTDFYEIFVFQNQGAARNILGGNRFNHFAGFRLAGA